MADQKVIEPLTDEELQSVAGDPAMVAKLTSSERRRLDSLTPAPSRQRTWTDTAVDTLPMLGGAAGGIIGGIGGTVAGMGVGGVPGAIGGATVGGAGGEALRQLVNHARGAEAPSTPGQAATDISIQGGVQGALEGVGQGAVAAATPLASAVYRGYLKPSLSKVNLPKAAEIVQTAISEAIPMTKGGLAQTQKLIGELNGKVNDLLSHASGRTVNLSDIANSVRTWAKQTYDRAGRDPRDYEAAMKVADRIDTHPSVMEPPFSPQPATADPLAANQIKRDLQGAARDKFGVPGGTAETAGEKFASSAMRKGIEQQAPGVGPLNMRESKLIDLARSLQRGLGRDANTQSLYGSRTIVAAGLGGGEYARSRNPYSAAAMALAGEIGLHPAVATNAAILATKIAAKVPGTAVADVARAAVQATSEILNQPAETGR